MLQTSGNFEGLKNNFFLDIVRISSLFDDGEKKETQTMSRRESSDSTCGN